jgi:hypothetical protein
LPLDGSNEWTHVELALSLELIDVVEIDVLVEVDETERVEELVVVIVEEVGREDVDDDDWLVELMVEELEDGVANVELVEEVVPAGGSWRQTRPWPRTRPRSSISRR